MNLYNINHYYNNDLEWKLYGIQDIIYTSVNCDFSNIEFREINILCYLNNGNNDWGIGIFVLKDEFDQNVTTNKRTGQSFHYAPTNVDYHVNCTALLQPNYKLQIVGELSYGSTVENKFKVKVLYR